MKRFMYFSVSVLCLSLSVLIGFHLEGRAALAQSFQIDGFVDVDNAHVLYTGDWFGNQLTFRGQGIGPYVGFSEPVPPTEYNFSTAEPCIYLVAWSDDAIAQGMLHNLAIDGTSIWFDDPRWEVFPSGIDRDDFLDVPAPSAQEVGTQVQIANTSNNWNPVTLGGQNDGTFPGCTLVFAPTPNIDTDAWWAWYDSGNAPQDECQPFAFGFNHSEYLIFRLCMSEPVPIEERTWGAIKALYDGN